MDSAHSFDEATSFVTNTNNIFQTLHSPFQCPLIDPPSPAICPKNLGSLQSPTAIDHEMFLSLFGTTSPSADISHDKMHSQLDQSCKCDSLPGTQTSKFAQRQPSYASQIVLSSPDNSEPVNLNVEVTRLNWCHDKKQADMPMNGVLSSLLFSGYNKCVSTLDYSAFFHFSRDSSVSDVPKQYDSSDSDIMANIHDDGKQSSLEKFPTSKNLVFERKRRKKLNERLYSLRAIVPKISKMDKASIIGDAITYVRDLQKQVQDMRTDISNLQSKKHTSKGGVGKTGRVVNPEMITTASGSKEFQDHKVLEASHLYPRFEPQDHKVLELEVAKIEEQTYHILIHCIKGPEALVQLTRVLEALDLEIVIANLTSVTERILNTFVVKVKRGVALKSSEELRNMALDVMSKFGLHL